MAQGKLVSNPTFGVCAAVRPGYLHLHAGVHRSFLSLQPGIALHGTYRVVRGDSWHQRVHGCQLLQADGGEGLGSKHPAHLLHLLRPLFHDVLLCQHRGHCIPGKSPGPRYTLIPSGLLTVFRWVNTVSICPSMLYGHR